MEGVADRKHADNYESNRQRQNTVQVEEKCTNVGFSRLVEQEWGNKEQHKELGFQVNLLDAWQHERNKQADNNLDNGDRDVDKLIDNRGSRDAGQNDEHEFKCLQQVSFLILRLMACQIRETRRTRETCRTAKRAGPQRTSGSR